MYLDLIVMRLVIEVKQLIFVEKARTISKKLFVEKKKNKGHKQKAFQTNDIEIRYDCAKRYHVLNINCAKGILFGL